MTNILSGRSGRGLLLSCMAFLLFYSPLFPAPSERLRRQIMLADGTCVEVTQMGDEWFSYFLSDEGDAYVRDSLGYRLMDADELASVASRAVTRRRVSQRRVGSASLSALKQHGIQRIPVVLVSFDDRDFTVAEGDEAVNHYYHLYCNGTGDGVPYTGHGSHGSLRDYFYDQSSGDFQPEFTVIGPVKLDKGYAYYGKNSADGKRADVNYGEFCSEAITKASEKGVDWTLFDNDGDNKVDLVMFLFAGHAESNSFDADAIWPKEVGGEATIAGITFAANSSVCENRLRFLSDSVYVDIPDGIGVFVHEMSHALGLPDFYDTKSVAFGMDYWSVMDYGEYADNGFTPVGYTAYERDFMGWQPLQVIDHPATLRIPSFAAGGCGWKVVSDYNTNEYYVLENRQADGWDVRMCSTRGHGLMVTHVDYSSTDWLTNTVNTNASHQRMTIIPANNSLIGSNNARTVKEWVESLRGNLWPGTAGNHELTDNTTPASTLFLGKYMSKPIVDIQEDANGMVTLKFMPRGTLSEASGLSVDGQTAESAWLNWEPVPEAQYYNVRVYDGADEVFACDSLPDNRCLATGLAENHVYTFSVQAMSDEYLNGGWAVPFTFSTLPTGISDMAESEKRVRVFGTDGLFVTECQADEIGRLALRAGIYVVRYPDSSVRKVFVR